MSGKLLLSWMHFIMSTLVFQTSAPVISEQVLSTQDIFIVAGDSSTIQDILDYIPRLPKSSKYVVIGYLDAGPNTDPSQGIWKAGVFQSYTKHCILIFIGKMLVPLGWYPNCLTLPGAL